MSSKSDRDNRSNQLNQNNSAYHSSRAGNAHSDDDYDDAYGLRQNLDFHTYVQVEPIIEMVGDYGVGLVTADGTPRFFTYQLKASGERLTSSTERTLRVRLEDYLERFTNALLWLTTSHYKARPALFVIFDGTSSRLPWHVPLHPDRPDLMKEFLLKEKPSFGGAAEPENVRSLLCSVLQPPYENWGAFEAEHQSASTLRFIYERRCREALASA